jgi:hypothetical protein
MQKIIASIVFSMCLAASVRAQSPGLIPGILQEVDLDKSTVTISTDKFGIVVARYDYTTTEFRRSAGSGQRAVKAFLSSFRVGEPVLFSVVIEKRHLLATLIATTPAPPSPSVAPAPTPQPSIEPFADHVRSMKDPGLVAASFLEYATTRCKSSKTGAFQVFYFHQDKYIPGSGAPCSVPYRGQRIVAPCAAYILRFEGIDEKNSFSMDTVKVTPADRANGIDARAVFHFTPQIHYVMRMSEQSTWSRANDGGGLTITMTRENGNWEFDVEEGVNPVLRYLNDMGQHPHQIVDPDEAAEDKLTCDELRENPFARFYRDPKIVK